MNEPTTIEREKWGADSGAAPCSASDLVNGLQHMADDHPCCGAFLVATMRKIEQMQDACRIALWIRDRLQERGSFGAGFEEWRDIEKVVDVTPNDQAERSAR